MSVPTQGTVRCSFCQTVYIIGQERVITNGLGSAYICKTCIKKFKEELHKPSPVTPPPLPKKDPA